MHSCIIPSIAVLNNVPNIPSPCLTPCIVYISFVISSSLCIIAFDPYTVIIIQIISFCGTPSTFSACYIIECLFKVSLFVVLLFYYYNFSISWFSTWIAATGDFSGGVSLNHFI